MVTQLPGIAALVASYVRRESTPEEIVELCLAAIAQDDPRIGAFAHLDPDGSRAAAKASGVRYRSGASLGPLDGVPVSIKDAMHVRGQPTCWGSHMLGEAPEHDETPVARLREAGAIILGKTNVPEFTLEGWTGNARFGLTRNPWDLRLTPGGSSGGAAASVAAGFCVAALGTDAGGSLRRPAAYCGAVGFKPSIGRVARANALPAIVGDLDVCGPIALNVDDIMAIDEAIAGPDAEDARARTLIPGVRRGRLARIAYIPRFGGFPVDREITASVEEAAHRLQTFGHQVETYDPAPFDPAEIEAKMGDCALAGLAYLVEWIGADAFHKAASSDLRERARAGGVLPAARMIAAFECFMDFRRRMQRYFETVDLVLTPTAAAMPWPVEQRFPTFIDEAPVTRRSHAVFTGWVNACGHPAISLPARAATSGLPIGFQLVGPFGSDRWLLETARAYETAHPWQGSSPRAELELRSRRAPVPAPP